MSLHEFHRRRADISYHPIVGSGPNACVAALPRQQSADAGRRAPAHRRRLRVRLLRLGRHPHAARRRALQPPPARDLRGRARGAEGARSPKVRAGAHWNEPHEAAVRAITRGLVQLGLLEGPRAEAHQGRRLPAVLHAPHRPLARHGCARRRRLQGRATSGGCSSPAWSRRSSPASTSRRGEGRAARVEGHRRAHRGRRGRHRGRSRRY